MKLSDASEYGVVESKWMTPMPINEDGEGPRWKFRYDNWKHDPTPDILLLGSWRHPRTGNNLVGGVNTNYLSQKQTLELAKALPSIMKAGDLQRRYWVGRRLVPSVFDNFYRTYNAAHIRGVEQDVMHPKYNFAKAAGDWIKKKVAGIFKSKAQRQKDAQPQYPDDLTDMQSNLAQAMTQLQQQRPDQPADEPEDTPEMRRAREAFQQFQRNRVMAQLQEPDIDDDIMTGIEQDALDTAREEPPQEIDSDNIRDQFEQDRAENQIDNEELDDNELEESIVYFDPRQRRYVVEVA